MRKLSEKVRSIEESQTLALAAKAKRMRELGVDVVSLTAGEPDFPTPRHIKDAAIEAIEADFTKYTATSGIPDLIEAVIAKFARENDLHFDPRQVVVSHGAKQSICNVLQAICNKGDEVVFFSPYWVSYPEMVKLADATPVIVPTYAGDGFRPDIQKLRRAITGKTKALILNSPNNPSGVVFTQHEYEQIAEIVHKTGIYVISDEIYEKVVYDGNTHFSIGSIKSTRENVITVNGVSKAFAMTGWRIGYAGGPGDVMEAAGRVQSQVTSNPNSIAQKAALAGLRGLDTDVRRMVDEFKRRRDFVHEKLAAIADVRTTLPGGAFYFFFDVSRFFGRGINALRIRNSADLGAYLLDHHHVATVPGVAFGDDSSLRISYACSMTELEIGLQRIREGVESLT
jgi:aspartate aminotransferase